MKRVFILFSLVVFTLSAYSIDKQVLADSLTSIVHQHAFAGKVDISRIRVKNQYVYVYIHIISCCLADSTKKALANY